MEIIINDNGGYSIKIPHKIKQNLMFLVIAINGLVAYLCYTYGSHLTIIWFVVIAVSLNVIYIFIKKSILKSYVFTPINTKLLNENLRTHIEEFSKKENFQCITEASNLIVLHQKFLKNLTWIYFIFEEDCWYYCVLYNTTDRYGNHGIFLGLPTMWGLKMKKSLIKSLIKN